MTDTAKAAIAQASDQTLKLNPGLFEVGGVKIQLRPGAPAIGFLALSSKFEELGKDPAHKGKTFVYCPKAKDYVVAKTPENELLTRIHERKKESQGAKLRRRFLYTWIELGGPDLQDEFQFHPLRKWRFDFCLPTVRVGIEIDGGVFINGGHNRGAQISKDYEKRNVALTMGYRVFQLTSNMMKAEHLAPIVKVCNQLLKKAA